MQEQLVEYEARIGLRVLVPYIIMVVVMEPKVRMIILSLVKFQMEKPRQQYMVLMQMEV